MRSMGHTKPKSGPPFTKTLGDLKILVAEPDRRKKLWNLIYPNQNSQKNWREIF